MLYLAQQKLLLCLEALDLAKIPAANTKTNYTQFALNCER